MDTDTCISVVTKLLVIALGLRWKLSTKNDVIAVDRKSQAAVRVIKDIPVVITDAQIFISLQVINSISKTLLLGIDWLDKYKADIFSSTKKLRFVSKGKIIEVNVVNIRDQAVKTPEDSNLCTL